MPSSPRSGNPSPRRRRWRAVAAALVAVTAAVPVVQTLTHEQQTADAAEIARDGSSAGRAAVSCWAIKKAAPTAASGAYWILTPQMSSPRRVYCDQTTDGGGWALVGRGREGWTFTDAGQGSADAVVTTPDSTGAFSPATLPATVVNQLFGGLTVNQSAGGVRLRLAANTAGTSWQEVRWNFAGTPAWRWDLPTGTGLALTSATYNGSTYTNRNTRDQTLGTKRIWTYTSTQNGSNPGFNNALSVTGSTSTTSYLWSRTSTSGYATPFTQVFVRPKLVEGTAAAGETTVTFPTIPDSGLAPVVSTTAGTGRAVASKPVGIGWGVSTEYDPNDQYTTLNTLVTSIEIIGDTVFVGGKYRYVRNGANAPLIEQPYLAAFNRLSGDWISTFRPTLDGSVWSLQATPDNKLLVAGNFTNVNGLAGTAGIFKLDPATMAPDPTFRLALTRDVGRTIGRSIAVGGDWAYLAGRFNNAVGGAAGVSNLGNGGLLKFKWSDGTPEPNWRPFANATVEDIAVSPTTDRLWMVGYFTSVSGSVAHSSASVSLLTGQRNDPPGMQQVIERSPITMYYDPAREPEWTVDEWKGFVYQGGTQHYFGRHSTVDYAQTAWSNQGNGDYQTQAFLEGLVYAGCHCGMTNTTKQVDGQQVNTGLLSAFGAWDPDTFARNTTFQGDVRSWSEGPWAMKADPKTACLWIGGDFGAGPPDVYLQGLAKFCVPGGPTDVTPPTTPTGATATMDATGTRLTWTASTDNLGPVPTYEVFAEDRLIGTTNSTSFTSPLTTSARYFVRALDPAGNRSATTAAIVPADTTPIALLPFGSSWRYSADGTVPPAGWDTTADVSSWAQGAAPLGAGGIGETTVIPVVGSTQYFVRDIAGTALDTWGAVRLRLKADDGAIVRVNGTQVARANLGFGVSGHTAVAWSPVTVAGGAATRDLYLPRALFTSGTNRISVELHQATAADTDAYMDLDLTATRRGDDVTAPAAPASLTAGTATNTAIPITWPVSPETDVAGYELRRNGVDIGFFAKGETSYLDQQLTAGTAYAYEVLAFDLAGNRSVARAASLSTTGTPPPPPPLPLATATSTWRYATDATSPPADWTTTGDLSAWASGTGSFGYGLAQTTTIPAAAITHYLATDVNIANPAAYRQVELTFSVDDGAVIRINGTEVARANLPFGVPGPTTPAFAARTGAPNIVTVRVPASVLVAGANRISIELHQAVANDVDAFASLVGTALPDNGDAVVPVMSTGSTNNISTTAIQLNWTPATDNAGIGYYLIRRNGSFLTIARGSAVNYYDQQLTRGTTYSYDVVAVDTNGNASAPLTLTAATLP